MQEDAMQKSGLIQDGWIEVICGCMFSGKSEEGGKRVTKEKLSKSRIPIIFVPRKSQRKLTLTFKQEQVDATGKMVSRNGKSFDGIEFSTSNPDEIIDFIREMTDPPTTVVIEEAHFCSDELVEVCKKLAEEFRLRVIVIGLDQKFNGEGFGPIPRLMVEAEMVTKELAVCTECGSQNASKSWLDSRERKSLENGSILVGDTQYVALCRHCYREFEKNFGKQ
ncbi:thymidine kinase [Patescibacteria group bacterium]|nr:thymidine kinase [Patescibacteria group bacterium]